MKINYIHVFWFFFTFGHKYFVKVQIALLVCFHVYFFSFYSSKFPCHSETFMKIKQNKFDIEIEFIKLDTIQCDKNIAV